jgi:hypothetical protein
MYQTVLNLIRFDKVTKWHRNSHEILSNSVRCGCVIRLTRNKNPFRSINATARRPTKTVSWAKKKDSLYSSMSVRSCFYPDKQRFRLQMHAETQALFVRDVIPLNVDQNWNLTRSQYNYFFSTRYIPNWGLDRLILEGFQTTLNKPHIQTHAHIHTHSVGLLCTSDRPDAETSTSQHTTFTRDTHNVRGAIRTRNPNKRATADPRVRKRGHWDGQNSAITNTKFNKNPFTECPEVACGRT